MARFHKDGVVVSGTSDTSHTKFSDTMSIPRAVVKKITRLETITVEWGE